MNSPSSRVAKPAKPLAMWRPLRAAGATPKPHAAAQWGQALER